MIAAEPRFSVYHFHCTHIWFYLGGIGIYRNISLRDLSITLIMIGIT